MTLRERIAERISKCRVLNIRVGSRAHNSADSYDIALFHKWLVISIREGTDRIKVVVGDKPNTWVVTVLDKKET